MREIKFRYHCLTEGVGSDAAFGQEVDGILFKDGQVSEVLIDGDVWSVAKDADEECGAVCQYTGFKDRNGKEIYEGDVVVISDMHDPETGQTDNSIATVEYRGSSLCYVESNGDAVPVVDLIGHGYTEDDGTEIIGNIYENPDLIDG